MQVRRIQTLPTMTKLVSLPHRAVIRISGPDGVKFLKGLCTAHIETLAAEAQQANAPRLHYGAFLRPQGKMIGDALLHMPGMDDIRIDVPAGIHDELVAKLNMYRLRAQVTIEALDAPVFVAFDGPLPDGFVADARGDIIGESFGFSYAAQTANATLDDWTAWRMARGLSDAGQDFGPDELYAIDANLDLLEAIDFHKGCYVGQELTSRMKRRGQIKNRIVPFRFENHPPEMKAEILKGNLRAGEVVAVADQGIGLALMRLDRMDGELGDSFGRIELAIPKWLAPYAIAPEAKPA